MNESIFLVSPNQNFVRTKPDTILRKLPNRTKHINIRVNKSIKKIAIDSIVRIEASSNYSLIYLQNSNTPIVSSKTLKHYVNFIGLKAFVYPHKSHFINKKYIRTFCFKNKAHIALKNNLTIPISRRKLKEIKDIADKHPLHNR